MNPYVAAGLVMCLIAGVALAATAWLAVMFNRRAKNDLTGALTPLAALIEGEVDLEDAVVKGRYGGHIVEGRMANASEGPGRVFRTELVDPAGGTAWQLTMTPPKGGEGAPAPQFESADSEMSKKLVFAWASGLAPIADLQRERLRVDYDPAPGRLRLIRSMRTRRDIPPADSFQRQLDFLVALGPANRRAQGAPE